MSRSHLESYSQEDAKKSWEILEQAITKIYEKKFYDLSYEELYRNGYFLVLHRHGELAYQNLQKSIRNHLSQYHCRLPQVQEDNFLEVFNDIWNDAVEMMKAICRIFLYMERNYIPQKTLAPLKIVCYQAFLHAFLENKSFCERFQQTVLGLIRNERDGMNVNRILIKNILGMLVLIFLLHFD